MAALAVAAEQAMEAVICAGCGGERSAANLTICPDGQLRCPPCVYRLTDWIDGSQPRKTHLVSAASPPSQWVLDALDEAARQHPVDNSQRRLRPIVAPEAAFRVVTRMDERRRRKPRRATR
jgi:hypothetical protein